MSEQPLDVVVIGSGFGATMVALTLSHKLSEPAPPAAAPTPGSPPPPPPSPRHGPRILMLERGTWWTTPVSTVQDKQVATYTFLKDKRGQPVQFWSSAENFKGFLDLLTRCVRRPGNEDGLYDMTMMGKRGFLGIFGRENDGVSVLRASGVGGGSLVYSNITIRPPDFVLDPWPMTWSPAERSCYYALARHAIGYGVLSAWDELARGNVPFQSPDPVNKPHAPPGPGIVNAGLSNIATRSARLNPEWDSTAPPDPWGRQVRRINTLATSKNAHWVDRARVFQTAVAGMGVSEYGTVDSSINDITPEGTALNPTEVHNYPGGKPINYCERQGRCNVGCLPGARHTLNKQLMGAMHGKPDGTPSVFADLSLQALAEVDLIRALDGGGYEIEYWQRDPARPWQKTAKTIRAKRVVVAAGCLGSSELLLRSKAKGGLPKLSDNVGSGFSTNGDYIAFAEKLPEKVSLTRGPATTSYAHINAPTPQNPSGDPKKFHILEDQGIPRALASTVGFGEPLIRRISKGRHHRPFFLLVCTVLSWLWHLIVSFIRAISRNASERQLELVSEDEHVHDMMCVVAAGREAAVGQFRLGTQSSESPLRVKRTDKIPFHHDPIYKEIRTSLDSLAARMRNKPVNQLTDEEKFKNPFLSKGLDSLAGASIAVSHPLGGCRMGKSAAFGVVDEFGRVFDASKSGDRPFYEGLYVVDAAIIPSALGVNPSLTIASLALRAANEIVKEIDPARGAKLNCRP